MRFTYAQPISPRQEMTVQFKGLNKTLSAQDGEFSAMQNMTGDHFPVLSPRLKRLKCHTFFKYNGMYGKDKLLWVDGQYLYYDGQQVPGVVLEDSEKTFVGMGAYVLIFPDRKVFNAYAYETGDDENIISSINASFTAPGDVTFQMCDAQGNVYVYGSGTEPPADPPPQAGDYWMDTSGEFKSLKKYSSVLDEWTAVATSHVMIGCPGIGANFKQYDSVEITGAGDKQFNTSHILEQVNNNWIVVTGILAGNTTQTYSPGSPVTVKRECPAMDYFTECSNRVWGCSSAAHEIYACRQGDPYNWRAYEGLSSDSYAVTVGTDGAFTGAAIIGGYPVFFKENAIHKIVGTVPANFALSVTQFPGVQYGSGKSLAYVGGVLIYKAVSGVMAYDGGRPAEISKALGNEAYGAAVGGSVNSKYYVSMRDANEDYHLFVFDMNTGLWFREDGTRALQFIRCRNDTFFVADHVLWAITRDDMATSFNEVEEGYDPGPPATVAPLAWYAETGDILWLEPDKKHLQKLQVKFQLAAGSAFAVHVQYDSSGTWEQVLALSAAGKRATHSIPLVPRRCDYFRVRLSGAGDVKVYGLYKTYTKGSDM